MLLPDHQRPSGPSLAYGAPNVCDGRHLLSSLSPRSASVVFFDPQYRGVLDHLSLGNEGARQSARVALPQMTSATISEFIRLATASLQPEGHLLLWLDKFHAVEGVAEWVGSLPLSKVDLIVWDKVRIGMGYRSRCRSEFLLVLQRRPTRAKGVWLDHGIPDVWPESVPRGGHPHAKPPRLLQALVRCLARDGELVVDPCAGSYSVMAAVSAAGGGRRFIGSDLIAPPAAV